MSDCPYCDSPDKYASLSHYALDMAKKKADRDIERAYQLEFRDTVEARSMWFQFFEKEYKARAWP